MGNMLGPVMMRLRSWKGLTVGVQGKKYLSGMVGMEKDGWEAHGGLQIQGGGPGDGGHAGHLYVGGRELCQCGSGEVPQCQAGVLDEGGNWCGEGALKEESELIRGFLSSYLLIVFWINLTTNMFNRLGSLVLS